MIIRIDSACCEALRITEQLKEKRTARTNVLGGLQVLQFAGCEGCAHPEFELFKPVVYSDRRAKRRHDYDVQGGIPKGASGHILLMFAIIHPPGWMRAPGQIQPGQDDRNPT